MSTLKKDIRIVNKLGLHARPAALLVQEASRFKATIELKTDEMKVNGKSIMGVMMLAAAYGSTLTVIATGEDAQEAIEALEKEHGSLDFARDQLVKDVETISAEFLIRHIHASFEAWNASPAATRVGFRVIEDGSKTRYCKRCSEAIE